MTVPVCSWGLSLAFELLYFTGTLDEGDAYNLKSHNRNVNDIGEFDPSMVDRIVAAIVEDTEPLMVVIFGSVAKGTAKDTSDIDLMVVMDTDKRFVERSFPIEKALFSRNILVDRDIFVVTPVEFERDVDDDTSLIHEAYHTGIIAYDAR